MLQNLDSLHDSNNKVRVLLKLVDKQERNYALCDANGQILVEEHREHGAETFGLFFHFDQPKKKI